MARSKTATDSGTIAGLGKQLLTGSTVNPLIGPQLHLFWEVQEKFLDEAEEFAKSWFARRRQATQEALRLSEGTTAEGAADPGKLLRAMNEWQSHSTARIAEDLQEWANMCSRCAGHLASGEANANKEVLEEASKEVAMAVAKHATPV